MLFFFCKHRAG